MFVAVHDAIDQKKKKYTTEEMIIGCDVNGLIDVTKRIFRANKLHEKNQQGKKIDGNWKRSLSIQQSTDNVRCRVDVEWCRMELIIGV